MDHEAQLKLQSYVDGEMPEADAKAVAQWLERDAQAAALVAELRQTNGALAAFEAEVRLPETREFFWSKIERDIQLAEVASVEPARVPLHVRLRRFLVPMTGVALIAFAGLMMTRQEGITLFPNSAATETALSDSEAFTYRDYSAGTTLVWLSYPAENELADDGGLGTLVE